MKQKQTIILMGIKHSGKTTLGRHLAERCGTEFYDLDDILRQVYRDPDRKRQPREPGDQPPSVRDIYRNSGRDGFQRIEADAASRFTVIAGENPLPVILALGGGTIENGRAMDELKSAGLFVYLREDEDILYRRVMKNGIPPFLPATDPKGGFHELYGRRHPLYLDAADLVVKKNDTSVHDALETLISSLREAGYVR